MRGDILFLCQFFYPEHNSSATLPFDTAKYLASCGYSVDALCGYPKEYSDEKKHPINETKDGVRIHRIKYLQFGRRSKIGRIVNYFSFTFRTMLHVRKLKKYKCVIVYSNPPLLPVVAVTANKLYKTKIVFVAYDLYPEVAYASDSVKQGSMTDRVMKRINRSMYARASRVVALTDEMKEFMIRTRPQLAADRVVTISNWAHEKTHKADNDVCKKFGFKNDDFIVAYYGNMGIVQDMETLLDAIDLLRGRDNIKFFFVGHGCKIDYVRGRVFDNENVKVCDFLIGENFEDAVSVASCCVVTLENGVKGMCAPSKYYSYLQGKKPVIAVVEKDSYLEHEIIEEKIGGAVNPGDSEQLAEIIIQMSEDPSLCSKMGERAGELYSVKYEMDIGLSKYDSMFQSVIYTNN